MDASHSITEPDAATAEKNHAIKALRIAKNGESYTVHIQLNWRQDEVFMSTVRDRKVPRKFKHLGRLIDYIESRFPSVRTLEMTVREV